MRKSIFTLAILTVSVFTLAAQTGNICTRKGSDAPYTRDDLTQTIVAKSDLEQRGKDSLYYVTGTDMLYTGLIEDYNTKMKAYTRSEVVGGLNKGFFEGFYDSLRTVLYWRVPLAHGHQEGLYVCYHENGNVSFEATMRNGKMEGLRHCYYNGGSLWHTHHYCGDKKNGKMEDYYTNGNIRIITYYKKEVENGSYQAWHKNGQRWIVGRYKNGVRAGKWKQYDQEGKLTVERNYTKTPAEIKQAE